MVINIFIQYEIYSLVSEAVLLDHVPEYLLVLTYGLVLLFKAAAYSPKKGA